MKPLVRPYEPSDALDLGWIFYRAVREGASAFYSDAQRRAWARDEPSAEAWQHRLDGLITFVCDIKGQPAGFMSLRHDGYLDLAYVAPEAMGKGVADAIYTVIEARAVALGLSTLTTDASHLARRFFLKRGWTELSEQTVLRHGVELQNFTMEKRLTCP